MELRLACVVLCVALVCAQRVVSPMDKLIQTLLEAETHATADGNSDFGSNYFTLEAVQSISPVACSKCDVGKHMVQECTFMVDTVCSDDKCVGKPRQGFDFNFCSGSRAAKDCFVSCAQGFEPDSDSDPKVVCVADGKDFAVSGCSNINECEKSPCGEHARCIDTVGSFECVCHDKYGGAPPTTACSPRSCDVHTCPAGFSRKTIACGSADTPLCSDDTCCSDIDECQDDVNPCTKLNSQCQNTAGSFECVCAENYYKHTNGECYATCPSIQKCPEEYIPITKFSTHQCSGAACGTEECCYQTCSAYLCPRNTNPEPASTVCPGKCTQDRCCAPADTLCRVPAIEVFSCAAQGHTWPVYDMDTIEGAYETKNSGNGFCLTKPDSMEKHSNPTLCAGGESENVGQRFLITFDEPEGSAEWSFELHLAADFGFIAFFDWNVVGGETQATMDTATPQLVVIPSVFKGRHEFLVYATSSKDQEQGAWQFSRNGSPMQKISLTSMAAVCNSE